MNIKRYMFFILILVFITLSSCAEKVTDYQRGYDDGYYKGYEEGREQGRKEGYADGYSTGQAEGEEMITDSIDKLIENGYEEILTELEIY